MPHPDPIILGAGASGLMCAIHCGLRGRGALVLDHADKAARKVRISGGGRCNFTNLGAAPEDFVCANPHFVKSALARYAPHDFLDFFTKNGLTFEEEGGPGRLFCREGARAVADLLESEAARLGARLLTGVSVDEVRRQGDGFQVMAGRDRFEAGAVVVAAGGPAWPQIGATDLGLRIAKSFGLRVVPIRPGLVPLTAPRELQALCREMSGVSLPARIRTNRADRDVSGDLLFTHRGLSGPAALDASLFWRPGETLFIDFLPGRDVAGELAARARMTVKNALGRLLPKRLAALLCDRLGLSKTVAETSKKELAALCESVSAFAFAPAGTEGFKKAETTLGGVDTDLISSKTMEAKAVPGLYFTGEVLDVAGRLGGFNLQWAWSSGAAAGRAL